MGTVQHPVFADQKYTVPDDAVQSWVDQGWVKSLEDDPAAKTSFEEALEERQDGDGEPVGSVTAGGFMPNTVAVEEGEQRG